jgi:hypothetical protein
METEIAVGLVTLRDTVSRDELESGPRMKLIEDSVRSAAEDYPDSEIRLIVRIPTRDAAE